MISLRISFEGWINHVWLLLILLSLAIAAGALWLKRLVSRKRGQGEPEIVPVLLTKGEEWTTSTTGAQWTFRSTKDNVKYRFISKDGGRLQITLHVLCLDVEEANGEKEKKDHED